jgi:hypothetical protein
LLDGDGGAVGFTERLDLNHGVGGNLETGKGGRDRNGGPDTLLET